MCARSIANCRLDPQSGLVLNPCLPADCAPLPRSRRNGCRLQLPYSNLAWRPMAAARQKSAATGPSFPCAAIILYNPAMAASPRLQLRGTIRALRSALANGITATCRDLADQALANANQNPEPQYLPVAGPGVDACRSGARGGDAERRRRPVRRWPRHAVGPAGLGEGLLRPGGRADQLRREVLSRSATASRRAIRGWWKDCARPAR